MNTFFLLFLMLIILRIATRGIKCRYSAYLIFYYSILGGHVKVPGIRIYHQIGVKCRTNNHPPQRGSKL